MTKTPIRWIGARRIIRTLFPTIHLFEDIADPADWPLLINAAMKTNPRLVESLGRIDLVPAARRVGGSGASYLMAPFVHVSTDRPSRFSAGEYGVLYAGEHFQTALFETMHHHGRFMVSTREKPGWASQFKELILDINVTLHDLRGGNLVYQSALDPDSYVESQKLGEKLRASGSEGLIYPSLRDPSGECAALLYPDCATNLTQGRHLDYHWSGSRVDLYRDASSGEIFRVSA
jgi:hypothetical protein